LYTQACVNKLPQRKKEKHRKMAQTPITPIVPLGPYLTGQPSALALALALVAADASMGNSFPLTGREILIVQNTDSAAHTFTLSSVPDALGRSEDVTAYSIPANAFAVFSFRGGIAGWKQTDGTVHMTVSSALLFVAVLTTPN
jgi:hypothetical protein